MKRTLRALGMALIASFLGLTLAVVPSQFSPEQAHALACTSSISATCNAANLPILIDAGVIKAGTSGAVATAPAVTQAVAKGSTGKGIWGVLKTAISTMFGISTLVDIGGEVVKAAGGLSTDGLVGVQAESNPDYGWPGKPSQTVSWAGSLVDSGGTVRQAEFFLPGFLVSFSGDSGRQSPCLGLRTVTGSGYTAVSTFALFAQMDGESSPRKLVRRSGASACATAMPGFGSDAWNVTGSASTSLQFAGRQIERVGISLVTNIADPNDSRVVWLDTVPSNLQTGQVTSTVQCMSPTSTTLQSVTATAVRSFLPGKTYDIPDVKCPAGWLAVGADVDWTPSGGAPQKVIDSTDTQVTPQQKELVTANPACWTSTALCVMTLEKVSGETCGTIGDLCPDWAKDPNHRSKYQCKYGGNLVALNMCSAYRDPSVGIQPNTGTNGEYLDPTAPNSTNIQTGVSTGSTPAPGSGSSNDPSWEKCRPSSILEVLNPFWVFKAVQCAIEVSFTPRESFTKGLGEKLKGRLNATSVGRLTATVSTFSAFAVNGGGCQGPPLPIKAFGINETWYPFNACSEPMSSVAASIKNLVTFLVLAGATLAMLRYVANIFGYAGYGQNHSSDSDSSVRFK